MAAGGSDAQLFEMLVCIRIHHQQARLIPSALDERHHLSMSHAFNVYLIHL